MRLAMWLAHAASASSGFTLIGTSGDLEIVRGLFFAESRRVLPEGTAKHLQVFTPFNAPSELPAVVWFPWVRDTQPLSRRMAACSITSGSGGWTDPFVAMRWRFCCGTESSR